MVTFIVIVVIAVCIAGLLYAAAAPNGDAARLERARIREESSAKAWAEKNDVRENRDI